MDSFPLFFVCLHESRWTLVRYDARCPSSAASLLWRTPVTAAARLWSRTPRRGYHFPTLSCPVSPPSTISELDHARRAEMQCCAQALIASVYMMFGLFVYSFQGQFTLALAFQGMSIFAWQTVGNVLAVITALIAAGLYGNIGISTYSSTCFFSQIFVCLRTPTPPALLPHFT